ncbi:GNAT family N-acetyltransferase [Microbacterium oryzae]|uniref:GNAT family N-acetyltransferase n=1 Tax=Microbacterium oryzae TaxID=743009 RepID=A0A6I6DTK5_9MICO|nr:GNAT family N-acetyltransferase [Microbacterium oryzae]QGU27426.1 GNAT family N-acetyltransferase [Microbacterium oryzae]
MSSIDPRTVPLDPTSRERLAATGLDYRTVDHDDRTAFSRMIQAVSRGFLGPEVDDAYIDEQKQLVSTSNRYVAVFDEGVAQEGVPVATVHSWVTELTVPGGELDMWAVSGVTVSPTHRRRGVARAMLEGELRAAADAGLAIAGLTATEATIYGRYGFGAAVPMSRWTIDTRRAGWAGYEPDGRVEFVSREQLADDLSDVYERGRTARPGEVEGWPRRWRQHAGLDASTKNGETVRGVRYRDAAGDVRGAMAYRIEEGEGDFRPSQLQIRHLTAETPEAAAALWRFALQHDLVGEVTAKLRPVDDPVRWLVQDERGATQVVHDHGWLRILDLPRAIAARTYSAAATAILEVSDPLGLVAGTWRIEIDADGRGRAESAPGATPDLRLGVAELSAAYLGGVPLTGLRAAGRVQGDAQAAAALTAALRPVEAPALTIWY